MKDCDQQIDNHCYKHKRLKTIHLYKLLRSRAILSVKKIDNFYHTYASNIEVTFLSHQRGLMDNHRSSHSLVEYFNSNS